MLPLLASAASGGAAQKAGLPQLDVATYAPQLIWLALTFIALYVLMSKVALPRIAEVVEGRKERIRRDLDEAERLKGETEKALKSYEQALGEAKARAQKIAQEMRDTLNKEVGRERADVDAKVATMTGDAEKRISAAKVSALGKVGDIATETAQTIVSELIGQQVSAAEARAALPKV